MGVLCIDPETDLQANEDHFAETLAHQVLGSLDAILFLKKACEADLLSVAVEVVRKGWIPSTGSAKRMISVC